MIKLYIENGNKRYEPIVKDGVTWETERKGSPGKLTFTVIKDNVISFQEGNLVTLEVDGENVFYGFVFKKTRDKNHNIKVTAYDQLRYLKNKDTMTYKALKASEVLEVIAKKCKLQLGDIDDTGYIIPERTEENQTYFDIILTALDLTVTNKKTLYVLYDDYGKLTLKSLENMKTTVLISEETGENFDYTSSIDDNTYNQIKIQYDNEKTEKKETFIAKDSSHINEWGLLQYYDTVKNVENAQAKADEIFKINQDGNIEVNRLKDIDDALASVRVADPAVGSGAFPLGMVNEIVRARENITSYMTIGMNANTKRLLYKNERSPYRLKKDTIKNSIFAVDIEPSAVDITQLRLWLSLVIDDEITPDAANELEGHRDPLPLPNLECNIVCGNSLVDEFMGIKLVNESDILHTTKINSQIAMGQSEFETILQKLLQAQDELFVCDDPNNKIRLKEYIQSYKDLIINNQIKHCSDEIQESYKNACSLASKPFVLWELDFARVFRDNGGFDIVIGNPPYVDSETMTRYMPEQRTFYTQRFESCKGNWDLFIPFVELGYLLSTDIGSVSYIIPNKIIAADYAKACRKMMSEYSVKEIRDYSSVRVFKEAAVYPITFIADKSKNCNTVKMVVMNNLTEIGWYNEISNEDIFATDKWDSFFAENTRVYTLIKEIIKKSTPLSEMATVKGAATVAEAYEVKNILTDSEKYDSDTCFKFINTGTIDPYISLWESAKTQYIKQAYHKPIVKKDELKKLYPRRYDDASKEKIIIGGMTKELECYYDSGETLAGKSTTIVSDSKVDTVYLTGLLNSKLMTLFYRNYFNSLSLAGGFYRVGVPQIKQLPIIIGTNEQQKKLIELATRMIKNPNDTDKSRIDKMVFEIYEISEDDVIILTETLK